MFTKTLSPSTLKLLQRIKLPDLPNGSYLAGGTAIALQLGHRKSNDLDFFTPSKFSEITWEEKLREEFGLKVIQKDWQTIVGNIENVKLSLFYYSHN